jgi:indolepyruvate ferredoxin oxidoreductase alpha subunit
MAERSFKEEVQKLRLSEGEIFRGEGILAVTKALLESGVAYVAGYQGAPISHLMDMLADAQDILRIGHPNHEIRSRFSKQVSAR